MLNAWRSENETSVVWAHWSHTLRCNQPVELITGSRGSKLRKAGSCAPQQLRALGKAHILHG